MRHTRRYGPAPSLLTSSQSLVVQVVKDLQRMTHKITSCIGACVNVSVVLHHRLPTHLMSTGAPLCGGQSSITVVPCHVRGPEKVPRATASTFPLQMIPQLRSLEAARDATSIHSFTHDVLRSAHIRSCARWRPRSCLRLRRLPSKSKYLVPTAGFDCTFPPRVNDRPCGGPLLRPIGRYCTPDVP